MVHGREIPCVHESSGNCGKRKSSFPYIVNLTHNSKVCVHVIGGGYSSALYLGLQGSSAN